MKITIAGAGYVGLSLSVLLSQKHEVKIFDLIQEKIEQINKRISPIKDDQIHDFLKNKDLNLVGTTNKKKAYSNAEIIIIATPTDYNAETNQFDTKSVESVIIDAQEQNPDATIVIKSTIPLGYCDLIEKKYGIKVIFSPEFLREGSALHDNLYPSRIIIGETSERAKIFGDLLIQSALKKDVPISYIESREAESIKLFSNTYLAMRVAFFNELDSFAEKNRLSSDHIIKGVGLDPRIGTHYSNPSFGYGGYCLPKDTKQLLASFEDIPQSLIAAIVDSNNTRMDFITDQILEKNVKKVGIYRLIMKSGSDNFRDSAVIGIMKRLQSSNIDLTIYEPQINEEKYNGYTVESSLEKFKKINDLIIANRKTEELDDVADKLYCRDIFGEN